MTNVHQFQPRGAAPQAANDAGPPPAATAPKARESFTDTRAGRLLSSAGRIALAVGLGALKLSLYVARVLAFATLSVARIFLRPVLTVFAIGLILALAMIAFGYDSASPRKAALLWQAGGGAVGCILLRFYYDELLAWLSPSRVQMVG